MKTLPNILLASAFSCALLATHQAAGAATETVLYAFCSQQQCADGWSPDGELNYVNGVLYGTTYNGGTKALGTAYSFDLSTATETVLNSFGGEGDGANPQYGLVRDGSYLLGITYDGGQDDRGTVFAVGPEGGGDSVIYTFGGNAIGAYPSARLVPLGNHTYAGTTWNGGDGGGSIYSIRWPKGGETALYSFDRKTTGCCSRGFIDLHGTLYGTTAGFGQYGSGTFYAFDLSTRNIMVLHSFGASGTDGTVPQAPPTSAGKAFLCGTTSGGGTYGDGTVYCINRKGRETVLHSFADNASDGGIPLTALLYWNGLLYGTTAEGGASGDGVVYAIDPATGQEQIVYAFSGGADGKAPVGPLIQIDGALYGTTGGGGANSGGTIFKLVP